MLFYFYSKKDNHLPGLMVVIFNFNIPIIVCRFLFPKQSLRRYRVCHPSFINFSRSKWIYTFPIPYLNIITVCRYFSFIPNISPDICIFIYCVSFFQSYRTDWSFFPSDFFILFLWDTEWGVIFFPLGGNESHATQRDIIHFFFCGITGLRVIEDNSNDGPVHLAAGEAWKSKRE